MISFMDELNREIEKKKAEIEAKEKESIFKKARLYNMDGSPADRPKVTQMVIDGFSKVLDAQDEKGVEKYGRTIDDAEDSEYNWLLMGLEEVADYSKYLVKEILRLTKEVDYWKNLHKKAPAHECKKNQSFHWGAGDELKAVTCQICNKILYGELVEDGISNR